MMKINLQLFGGRGSAGGTNVGSSSSQFENATTKKMMSAWTKSVPEGLYSYGDDEYMDVRYEYENNSAVTLYVDDKASAKMYQQYKGEWRIEDYFRGTTKTFDSPQKAANYIKKSFGDITLVEKRKRR